MIYQLLPHFRAPRYRSIKMHDQSSSKKSEQYVVFYLQQVDARKHQESSSMSVLCTWHIRRGELEYLYQTRTKWHTCLPATSIISTNLSEALWHLRPTDYTTVLALWPTGRKTGQEAIKKSIGKVEGQGRQWWLRFRFQACHNRCMFLNMNLSILWNGSHSHGEWNSMALFPI